MEISGFTFLRITFHLYALKTWAVTVETAAVAIQNGEALPRVVINSGNEIPLKAKYRKAAPSSSETTEPRISLDVTMPLLSEVNGLYPCLLWNRKK